MKIIDLLNKIANGEENDLITEFEFDKQIWNFKGLNDSEFCLDGWLLNQNITITKHYKKILEEEKKFTKEDFIKERMGLEGITREYFDKRYEVKECNCGMPYCKGFRAIEKEEKKIPEKLEYIHPDISCSYNESELLLRIEANKDKINSIIDYLKSKGE